MLQAAGAALLVPTSLGLLLPEFPLERRATATALWGAVGGVAAATGPSLGGLLIEWGDWRLVFFVNLVLGAAAWVPGAAAAARDARPGPRRGARRARHRAAGRRRRAALAGDRRGAGLGLGERAGARRVRGRGASRSAAFVRRSMALAHPVLELSLFRVRSFAAACAGVFVFSLGFYAVLLANILFLTVVWGYSTLKAGVRGHARPADGGALERARGARDRPLRPARRGRPGRAAVRARVRAVRDRAGRLRPRTSPEFLPATLLTGTGVGLSFAGFSSAAVAELPPARFATGSASRPASASSAPCSASRC